MRILWLFLVMLALCALQSILFRRLGMRSLAYKRTFSRTSVHAGDRLHMIETLENRRPLPIPWLRTESRISPHLCFGMGEQEGRGDIHSDEHTIDGDMYHRSLFFLPGFSRVTRRHAVIALQRGFFSAASVTLTSGDLFGMSANTRQEDTGAVLEVYPRLLRDAEIPSMCRRFLGDVLVKRYILPDPFLTNGTRTYRPGDVPRQINWRATARAGELLVNTFDFTADPKLLVVLNVQLAENQWDNLSPMQMGVVENAVSLAATLCVKALESGAEAGLTANTDTKAVENQCVYLAPMRSRAQGDALLSLCARITLRRALNFYTLLERLSPPADADILVLSAYSSPNIERALDSLRMRGHNVAMQLLNGGEADERRTSA